jgi:putative redox protein
MDIKISFEDGLKVNAITSEFAIKTDQPKENGGDASAPDPFTIFLGSIGTCAGYYALKFCQTRDISMEGFEIDLSNDFNQKKKRAENIKINFTLPESFPKKYHKALLKSVDQCTVKNTILFGPNIDIGIN